jgi:hypothetical protein
MPVIIVETVKLVGSVLSPATALLVALNVKRTRLVILYLFFFMINFFTKLNRLIMRIEKTYIEAN